MGHSQQILNMPLILSNFEGLYLARWCMVVRGWGANLLNRPPTKSTSIFMPLISPTSEIWWNHFGGKFKFCWRCVLKKREPRRNSNITHSTSRPANRGLTQIFYSASLGKWKQKTCLYSWVFRNFFWVSGNYIEFWENKIWFTNSWLSFEG